MNLQNHLMFKAYSSTRTTLEANPTHAGEDAGKQAACNSMTCRPPARAVVQQLTAGLVQLRLESIIEITTGMALTVSQTSPHSLLVVMQEEVCEGQAHNHGDHRVL